MHFRVPPPRAVIMNASDCEDVPFIFSSSDRYLAGSFAALSAFVGAALNGVAILALLLYPKTRTHRATPYVISLASSDLIFSAVTLTAFAVRFFEPDYFATLQHSFFCKIFPVFVYGTQAITLLSLTVVTIDRLILVYFGRKMNKHKTVLSVVWLLPVLVVLPSFFGAWGSTGMQCNSRSCTFLEDHSLPDLVASPKLTFLVFAFFIPSVVLLIANGMIFFKVRSVRNTIRRATATHSLSSKNYDRKFARMMFAVFAYSLLTYIPTVLIKIVDPDEDSDDLTPHVYCYITNWTSVVVNPIIYVVSQERYRDALTYTFTVKKSSSDQVQLQNMSTDGPTETGHQFR